MKKNAIRRQGSLNLEQGTGAASRAGDEMADEDLFAQGISADVLRVLANMRFVELLDERFGPLDPLLKPAACAHTFENSVEILNAHAMSSEEIDDVRLFSDSKGRVVIARFFTTSLKRAA